METVGSRLRRAIERRWGPRRIKTFHENNLQPALREREAAGEKIPGSSYATLHSYLGDRTAPTREWLEVAAELLDVPVEWLERGEEPPPPVPTDDRVYGWETRRLGRDEAVIRELVPGLRPEDQIRRRALRRFAQKLADAETRESPWSDPGYRYLLLRRAHRFLEGVDRLRAEEIEDDLISPGRLVLTASSSRGWQTTWTDAVFELFSRLVYGLGERSGGLYDAHVAPNPLHAGDHRYHDDEGEEDHDAT